LHYAISETGTLIYVPGISGDLTLGRTLVWVDREGKEEPLEAEIKLCRDPKVSPDGTRIAMTIQEAGGNTDIWIWDLMRKASTRLTHEGLRNLLPVWSWDSKKIVYLSSVRGTNYEKAGIYRRAADGTGGDELLSLSSNLGSAFAPFSWSGDGTFLVGTERFQRDIGMLLLEGKPTFTPLLQEEYRETQPALSTDGKWLAYTSDESGRNEVYLRSFPDINREKVPVSTNGGNSPRWSRDGTELFYRSGDSVMFVSVKNQPRLSLGGIPRALIKGEYVDNDWDVSADGKRFLLIRPPDISGGASAAETPMKINFVLNWSEELKQRMAKQ